MRELVSLEAEQSVIGALLSTPSCAPDVFNILSVEDFSSPQHQTIMAAIDSAWSQGKAIDPLAIWEAAGTNKGTEYALELAGGHCSAANVKSYALIVKDRARFRALSQTSYDIGQMVYEKESYEEALAEAQALLINLETTGAAIGDPRCSRSVLKSVVDNIDRRMQMGGKIDGLSTGLTAIDERLAGLKAGQLMIIAARPSMGKSAYGMQIVQHNGVNHGKNCLVFSLEMTSEELTERMIANAGGLVYNDVKSGAALTDCGPQFSMAAKKIADADINFIDAGGLHINQMAAISRKWHRRKPLDLIMVDHINIMAGDGQSREREISQITGTLKSLAKELGCPIIALSQLNRGVESRTDKRPVMSDLRDSGSIEQDADIIQMLYRDDYYTPSEQQSPREGLIDVFTRKFRNGETGDDVVLNNFRMMKVEDCNRDVPDFETVTANTSRAMRY